jgi:hypothetical protein
MHMVSSYQVRGHTLQIDAQPNPFNPQTTIGYSIYGPCWVRLAIYDCRGRLVTTLLDARLPSGPGDVVWNGRDSTGAPVSSGVYFAHLETEHGVRTQKVVVAR